MSIFKDSISSSIKTLQQISMNNYNLPITQELMRDLISKAEENKKDNMSSELEYWLGIAWRNYTSWFVRGDERKIYLDKAINHLENAITISQKNLSKEWLLYARELGVLLIDEAIVRNLERGIFLLDSVYISTDDYDPCFCSYANAFYKQDNFLKSATVAIEILNRAKKSKEWKDSIPLAIMDIIVKSYRAYIKFLISENHYKEALDISKKLMLTGFATESDKKRHEKMKLNKTL